MTWCDEPDDDAPRIQCRREHAASLNAFTVAQADKQWFHHPDSKPPRASGNLLPLAPQLLTRFELDPPVALRRRHAVDAQRMLEQAPLTQRHQVPMYWLSRH